MPWALSALEVVVIEDVRQSVSFVVYCRSRV